MIFQISRLLSVARYDKNKSLIRQGKPFDIFVLKMHIEVPWLLTTAEKSYSPDAEECLSIRHDDPGIGMFQIR